jgi:hypothetical protein
MHLIAQACKDHHCTSSVRNVQLCITYAVPFCRDIFPCTLAMCGFFLSCMFVGMCWYGKRSVQSSVSVACDV